MKVCLGSKELLYDVPKPINIEGRPWILTKDKDGFPVLYSAICPHQNGIVAELKKDVWRCPNHGWTYDPLTGKATNVPDKALKSFQVRIENKKLFADLPIPRPSRLIFDGGPKIPPKITVVGAAGLLFQWKETNILSDPWMEGPCMLGSWTNYPPSGMLVSDLPKIDAIWISHEHSDHYHEPTLSLLDKNIPVYLTKFNDGHLAKRLKKLGFTKIREIKTGQSVSITKEIKLISFESASIWNDSISFWKFGNFMILNVNDAGFNWKIKDIVGKVDLVCQQFTGPTSSYPYAWNHLDEKEKLSIITRQNIGMLNMMQHVSRACQAKYVIPFANFFELGNPEHLKYMNIQIKNSLKTVVKYFQIANKDITVLDLIPGESWNGKTNQIQRRKDREKFFDKSFMFQYLKEANEHDRKKGFVPNRFDITHEEIKNYFEAFSGSKLAKEVGKYTISFTATEKNRNLNALITFNEGNVTYTPIEHSVETNMKMSCPGGIVQEIIRNDLSWDEAINGFWPSFSRKPDFYNIHLWRLLYAPWQARSDYIERKDLDFEFVDPEMSIADIIERGGKAASDVFEKYGLYCNGCQPGMAEKIEDGCKLHGLSKEKTMQLIEELSCLEYN